MAPWNSEQSIPDYALQGVMHVNLNAYDRTVFSYMIPVGKKPNLLRILEHFIKDLDNPEFVKVVFLPVEHEAPEEKLYGSTKSPSFIVKFSVHKEDINKIEGKESIRIICTTDAFPENKAAFIDFFEELHSVMRF